MVKIFGKEISFKKKPTTTTTTTTESTTTSSPQSIATSPTTGFTPSLPSPQSVALSPTTGFTPSTPGLGTIAPTRGVAPTPTPQTPVSVVLTPEPFTPVPTKPTTPIPTQISKVIQRREQPGVISLVKVEGIREFDPTAKEQFFEQSFPRPSPTGIGAIPTREEFLQEAFFTSLLGQKREFQALTPEEAALAVGVDPRFAKRPTPEGDIISFVPDVERAKVKARVEFGELPFKEREKLVRAEVGFGLAKFGVGVIGFTGDIVSQLGVQTIKEGEKVKILDTSRFGATERALGKIKPIRDIQEKELGVVGFGTQIGAGAALLIAGGISGFRGAKALRGAGFTRREALIETAGLISPLRPKPGIFVTKIPIEPQVEFGSIVRTRGGITTRRVKGFGEGFKFESKQLITKLPSGKLSIGKIETIVTQPTTRIGGGVFREGRIFTRAEGFIGAPSRAGEVSFVQPLKGFKGIKLKTPLKDLRGGISTTLTQPKAQLFLERVSPVEFKGFGQVFGGTRFQVGRGAAVSKRITESLSGVRAGRRLSIPKVERGVLRPSGVFKLRPTFKGLEINLNKLFAQPVDKGLRIVRPSGVRRTPLEQTFAKKDIKLDVALQKSQQAQLSSIQTSLRTAQLPKVKPGKAVVTLVQQPRQELKDIQKTFQQQFTKQQVGISLKERQRGGLALATPSKTALRTSQRFAQDIIQVQKQQQQLTLKQRQVFRVPTPIEFFEPFPLFTFRGFGGFALPPILPLGQPERKRRVTKGRKFIETPTIGAVLGKQLGLDIKGFKESAIARTGLVEREFKIDIKLPTVLASNKIRRRKKKKK